MRAGITEKAQPLPLAPSKAESRRERSALATLALQSYVGASHWPDLPGRQKSAFLSNKGREQETLVTVVP